MASSNPIAVIGAGSWGTALAVVLAGKGGEVRLWGRRPEHLAAMRQHRENSVYLPGVLLPENLQVVDGLAEAVLDAAWVVMVVPSHGFRQVFAELVPHLRQGACTVSAVKGIEIETRLTMTQVMTALADPKKNIRFGVLSGPSFAEEVAAGRPTAVTVAFADLAVAREAQQLFSTSWFRVYSGNDVLGLEISGAVKNVIAIAAGICDGLDLGLNARAALITRGLAEMARLGKAMGADPQTFSGLGGLGDLVLTCTGSLSRNRTVGFKLGQGMTLGQILAEMTMVAEGVRTTKSCFFLAQSQKIDMPILEKVYQILYEDKDCLTAVQELFQRDLKEELH